MIQKIRIQNFRSIQDATVELGRVNLFIGPNNSGKSNVMKGIELMADILESYPADYDMNGEAFDSMISRSIYSKDISGTIRFIVKSYDNDESISLIIKNEYSKKVVYDVRLFSEVHLRHSISVDPYYEEKPNQTLEIALHKMQNHLNNTRLYSVNPFFFQFSTEILDQDYFNSQGDNISAFLFTLSQNYRNRFKALEKDLEYCLGDFSSVGTPVDPDNPGKLKLKLFDKNDNGYWAEEVSEGVLYFLALLCIIHQPNPPKLLLLEEPEKGIHPRRIQEVMEFIFQLAEEKDIQIIITSHSPYVVDHFADISECISVFDKVDGVTQVRNAAHDILEPLNRRNEEQGLPPVRYTDSLGEHWVSGFIGGVPV